MSEEEQAENANETVITVNGEAITQRIIEREVYALRQRYNRSMLPGEFEQKEPEIEKDARENVIERTLLVQEAKKQFPKAPKSEVNTRLNQMKREAGGTQAFYERYGLTPEHEELLRKDLATDVQYEMYLDEVTQDVAKPGDEACQEFYEKNEKAFTEPERVRASHILISADSGLDAGSIYTRLLNLKKQLEAGEDFNAIAAQISRQPGESGDLGWFSRGQMVPEFEQAAFAMQPGEISDVIQTNFGYHLIKVFEREPESLQPLSKVKKEIRDLLWEDTKNKCIGEHVDGLREQSDVVYLDAEAESSAKTEDAPAETSETSDPYPEA